MSAYSAIISIFFKKRNHGTLWCFLSVWVCSQHTRKGVGGGEVERERSAVSHGCELLQKISPHLLLSPPPHLASIIPVLSKQLRWQWEAGGHWNPPGYGPAFLPVLPRGCWPLVRSAARSLTVLCAVPVVKKGGWTRRNSTVRSSRKEGDESQLWEALHGRCYEPLGLNWAEMRCRLAASWRWENPG